MPKWRLSYHIVRATRGRAPLIDEGNERLIRHSIQTTSRSEHARLHAVGMMPDHVHVAASVPPVIARSQFVGRLKGASTHAVNALTGPDDARFAWQAEYGVFSFTEKNLAAVVAYIENQRQLHAKHDLWHPFEDVESP